MLAMSQLASKNYDDICTHLTRTNSETAVLSMPFIPLFKLIAYTCRFINDMV